jgi:hypothetical protein
MISMTFCLGIAVKMEIFEIFGSLWQKNRTEKIGTFLSQKSDGRVQKSDGTPPKIGRNTSKNRTEHLQKIGRT